MVTKPIRSTSDVPGLTSALGSLANASRIVCIGDSITAGDQSYVPNTPVPYPLWLKWLTGYDVINKGVSGNHLHDIRDRIATDVIPQRPSKCIVLGGTNDFINGDTVAAVSGYATQITTALLSAGIEPIYLAVLPRATSDGMLATITQYNAWLARHCREQGLQFIDTFSLFANADGSPKAGYLYDTVHPTDLGYKALGEHVASRLTLPAHDAPWRFPGETLLFSNGNFSTDSNADGTADGFTKAQTSGVTNTTSLVDHPTDGKWQKITRSGGVDINSYAAVWADVSGLAAGDVIEFAVDCQTNASLGGGLVRVPIFWKDASFNDLKTDQLCLSNYRPLTSTVRFRGVLTAPTNAARLRIFLAVYGTGSTDASFGRLAIRRVVS